ncbi:hypothetical protein VO64_3271 [Pseudomonas synxantha]|uniref:Uncharacterized protein n=1 Tax=Pseudomonas synxantha TaxID=47883 RepID=A0AAU8TZP9_9PSED|nr:hypothetical protein VO64_3271 [Pseudomonas synxantha]
MLNILYAWKALKNSGLALGHARRGFEVVSDFLYVFLIYL